MQIRLIDAAFPYAKSMSAKGENAALKPKYFEWYRGNDTRPVTFFTDSCLHLAPETKAEIKVAWLLEPPPFRTKTYHYARVHADQFDYILTYNRDLLCLEPKYKFYPYGGSMIAPERWGQHPKSKGISMIVSGKNEATGHRLRHEIVKRLGGYPVDVLGSGYGGYVEKFDGLAEYRHSIIVSGERLDWCFDEKLIDCLAVGTVPIFWGCPDIGTFFDTDGIIQFGTIGELFAILDALGDGYVDWALRGRSIDQNREAARQYLCTEDWIFEHHKGVFGV